jgi:hypothetical protein
MYGRRKAALHRAANPPFVARVTSGGFATPAQSYGRRKAALRRAAHPPFASAPARLTCGATATMMPA